ncbi:MULTISPECIES: hypothetical protein [unclassified Coleofasciculus]|uniref:hypothetical protein n=1 Tax=unclassified Coleofasciculus TaxID=2692782 RepID=UPI0018825BC1|nr:MULTISPECIES: hypothetical protein [unclassified Coleofasciculus]MBE9127318.1 hypothetical protein [Coleofasciculus sp. LEGE 07081]MBE9150793.1 hypothetical protein [Coleofasciculus sp. LEGE 07092]
MRYNALDFREWGVGFRASTERSPNVRERQRSTERLRPELAEGSRRSPNGSGEMRIARRDESYEATTARSLSRLKKRSLFCSNSDLSRIFC